MNTVESSGLNHSILPDFRLLKFIVLLKVCSIGALTTSCNDAMDKQDILRQADRAYNDKKYELAVSLYTDVLQEEDTCIEALFGRALCYDLLEEHDNAIADYTAYINLSNDEWHVYANRASAYYKKDDYTMALKDFISAQNLHSIFDNPISHMLFVTGFKDSACHYYSVSIAKGDTIFDGEIRKYCEE
jgi:tetratricopeptide (TPR) repeat protein